MATTQVNGDSHRILARTNDAPVVTLDTHGRNAQAVAFTSDGAFLLSAGQDACVRLWKPPGFRPAGELRGHTRGVYALALSPDRTRLATASRDGTVRVWALREREVRHILDQQMAAEFSPDGAQLATLIAGGFGLALWDVGSGARLVELLQLDARLFSLAYSPDGTHVLAGGIGAIHRVRVHDLFTDARLVGHQLAIAAMRVSPNGRWLATTGADGVLRLWSLPECQLAHTIALGGRGAAQLAFEPQSQMIAVALDHRIQLHRVDGGSAVERIELPVKGVHGLAFSPDSRYLACAAADGRVRIWATRLAKRRWAPVDQRET
jgi:WD40 repeat protein